MNIKLKVIIFLILSSCGQGFREDDRSASSPVKEYSLKEYLFIGETTLNHDLEINASRIIFKEGSVVKIKGFQLSITTDTLVFENNTKIFSFDETDYGPCLNDGTAAGDINIEAEVIKGTAHIDLAGENAAPVGHYDLDDVGFIINESDSKGYFCKNKHYYTYRNCTAERNYNTPDPINDRFDLRFSGGRGGKLVLSSKNFRNNFNLSARESKGNPVSCYGVRDGKLGGVIYIGNGPAGESSRLCIKDNEEVSCF